MKNVSKGLLFVALLFSCTHQLIAQDSRQLLSSTSKTFKVHFGIEGGIGANYLFSDRTQKTIMQGRPESSIVSKHKIYLAPRPDAQFGIFSEIEFKRWDFKVYIGYLGKTVPKPVEATTGNDAPYNLAYINNVVTNAMAYYKPSSRLRIGLGIETHTGFIGNKKLAGDFSNYWGSFAAFMGLRAEVGYQLNPRMHLNTYATIGKYGGVDGVVLGNASAGVTVSYRLKGKEYEIKKDIYRINYEAEVLPKAPKGIGH